MTMNMEPVNFSPQNPCLPVPINSRARVEGTWTQGCNQTCHVEYWKIMPWRAPCFFKVGRGDNMDGFQVFDGEDLLPGTITQWQSSTLEKFSEMKIWGYQALFPEVCFCSTGKLLKRPYANPQTTYTYSGIDKTVPSFVKARSGHQLNFFCFLFVKTHWFA